jgi:DNA replication protein DnaC
MNQQFYRTLNYEYQKKRDQAQREAEARRQEIYQRYPQLQELDNKINEKGFLLIKSALSNATSIVESQENITLEINGLKENKNNLLKKIGISLGCFEPSYECNLCKDSGHIEEEKNKMCSCYKQKLINLAFKQSNLCVLEKENFNTFDLQLFSDEKNISKYGTDISPRENIIEIKEICHEFIGEFENPESKNLLFVGDAGRGKTFLSNCIISELMEKGKTVIYKTAPALLDLVMDYKMRYERPDTFKEDEYNFIFEADLLIIDDLGAEATNSARFSELFNIINSRILTQQSKCTKTILSTNLPLEKLREYYDLRIMSRILGEFDICKLFGDDIRIKRGRVG